MKFILLVLALSACGRSPEEAVKHLLGKEPIECIVGASNNLVFCKDARNRFWVCTNFISLKYSDNQCVSTDWPEQVFQARDGKLEGRAP